MKRKIAAISLICCILFVNLSITKATEEYSPTKEDIQLTQMLLNMLGYDCGSPDGIMGTNTINSLMQYQSDVGLEPDGAISLDLFDYLSSGVPLKTYEKRYNKAIDDWNLIPDVTHVTHPAQHITFDETIEQYCPNDNLTLIINPGYQYKKIIGSIKIGNYDNDCDVNLMQVEIISAFYALNPEFENIGAAQTAWTSLLYSEKDYYSDSPITYHDYSNGIDFSYKAENQYFKDLKVTENNTNTDNIDKESDASSSLELFEISSKEKLDEIMGFLGSSIDVVEKYSDIPAVFNEPYEESKYANHYKWDGVFIGYNGYYSMSFDNDGEDGMLSMTFHFDENEKSIDPDAFINDLNNFFEMHYSSNNVSDTISNTCVWKLEKYTAKLCYNYLDDPSPQYKGIQFISFNND